MEWNIKTSPGAYFDYASICFIKREKGIKLSDDQINILNDVLEAEQKMGQEGKLFWNLVNVNRLIWWCMDIQREYKLSYVERSYAGLIVAVLNDWRDKVKNDINKFFDSGINEAKKYL